MIEKPMNPYAAEDFRNAVERANKCMKDFAEKVRSDFPFMDFEDMTDDTEDELTKCIREVNEKPLCREGGKALLNYRVNGAYDDFINILLANDYEVTAKIVSEDKIEIRFKPWKNKVIKEDAVEGV